MLKFLKENYWESMYFLAAILMSCFMGFAIDLNMHSNYNWILSSLFWIDFWVAYVLLITLSCKGLLLKSYKDAYYQQCRIMDIMLEELRKANTNAGTENK